MSNYEVNKAEIFDWVSGDISADLQGLSPVVQYAAQAAETRDRVLLVNTAIGTRLLDRREELLSELGIIDGALGFSLGHTHSTGGHETRIGEQLNEEIGPLTLSLRGLHKVGEACSSLGRSRNTGYLNMRDRIHDITGVDIHAVGKVASLVTTPNAWHLQSGEGDPNISMVFFHPEDDASQLPPNEERYIKHYPKAVSFNGLTYEKCLKVNGVGPRIAAAFILTLSVFGKDQSSLHG